LVVIFIVGIPLPLNLKVAILSSFEKYLTVFATLYISSFAYNVYSVPSNVASP